MPDAALPPYRRGAFARGDLASLIGNGGVGGKAQGLLRAARVLRAHADEPAFTDLSVTIPQMAVLGTEVFAQFMQQNQLDPAALAELPDDRIAAVFQQADLPAQWVGDLRQLAFDLREPLALRSSSLLEDRMVGPFAGVYGTKMVSNDAPDAATRFKKLVEAIKFIYASVFFREPREYFAALGEDIREERMAVILQRVVGERHGDRFYPHVSGVARSFNFYPFGSAQRREGIVHLALGLGKWVVDGETVWMFVPAHPRQRPPFASNADLLKRSQLEFWAVRMGKSTDFDPLTEDEYLERYSLYEADYDGVLDLIASTYDPDMDRFFPGATRRGPKVLDFAPILQYERVSLTKLVSELLAIFAADYGTDVEIEFALVLPRGGTPRFEFLQVRGSPTVTREARIDDAEFRGEDVVVRAESVLGNGVSEVIRDIVYLDRHRFDAMATRDVASCIARLNAGLVAENRPYLLIGFGRWGSADEYLGVPVDWSQIAGARAIVELPLPHMQVDPSQGSHFFHNVVSFGVAYFHVLPRFDAALDWEWLESLPETRRDGACVHVRLPRPLQVKVDGESGRGIVRRWRD